MVTIYSATSTLIATTVLLVSALISYLSFKKVAKNQFYSASFPLVPIGIFIWGDGFIVGPFWFFSGLAFFFLSPLVILRYFLLFCAVRFFIEVIYWVTHQFSESNYRAPTPAFLNHLQHDDIAILYQLLAMTASFVSLALFIGTFFV